jgi:hypothetical protein
VNNVQAPTLDVFAGNPHEIMELLTLAIGRAPPHCAACAPAAGPASLSELAAGGGSLGITPRGTQLSPRGR